MVLIPANHSRHVTDKGHRDLLFDKCYPLSDAIDFN